MAAGPFELESAAPPAAGWSPLSLFPRVTGRFVASFVVPAVLFTMIAAITAILITGHFLRQDAERNHNALANAFATAASQGAYTLDADYLQALADSIVKAPQITEVRIVVPGLDTIAAYQTPIPADPRDARIHELTLGIPSPIADTRPDTIGRITIVMTYDNVRDLSLLVAASNAFFVTLIACALIALSLLFVRRTALTPLATFARVVSASPDEYMAPREGETEIDSLFRFSRQKVEALAMSERRMSTLIANVPGIVFRYRGSFEYGRLEYISAAVEDLLGYTIEEVLSQDVVNMMPPWLAPHSSDYIGCLQKAYSSGEAIQAINRATTKSGDTRWLHFSSRLVEEFADGGFSLEGVAIDVTEQYEKKQELAEAVSREFKLQEQLAETRRRESLGLLAGGIAHDFNNILGAARSFADLITQETVADTLPHRYAGKIVVACDRAAEVVRQILLFTRAKETSREPLYVDPILSELEPVLDGRLPERTHLIIRRDPTLPPVIANAAQLGQVLLNLAINASDALEGRPGTVTIAAYAVQGGSSGDLRFEKGIVSSPGSKTLFCATGALKPGATYISFAVKDTGAGIPPEVAAKIFDPFFTTKENRKGSGLGLAVAQGIIAAHDGVITALSTEGVGTTFQVYLPASDRPPAAIDEKTKSQSVHGNERILIVDDDMDVADGLSLSLTRLGYETAPVYSPQEALEIFVEDPTAWDMVITDQVMPGLAGVDLVREMRRIRPTLRTILCSGFSENLTEAAAFDAGVDAFLHKPIPVTDVAAAIRRLVKVR